MLVMLLWVYIHTGQAWKICLTTVGIEPTTFGILTQCSASIRKVVGSIPTVVRHIFSSLPGVDIMHSEQHHKHHIHPSTLHQQKKNHKFKNVSD
jgi:hypothetical protein